MIRPSHIAALALLAGGLAACAPTTPPRPTPASTPVPAAPKAEEAGTSTPAFDPMAFDPARRPLSFAPDDLKGLDGAMLLTLLGEPTLIRAEPPAEVWQYRAETCVLDLVFYEAEDGNLGGLSYLSSRPTGVRRLDDQACLDAVRAERTRKIL